MPAPPSTYCCKKVILAVFCFTGSFLLQGQDVLDQDSVAIQPDKVETTPTTSSDSLKSRKFISGVELKVDYGKLLMAWTSFETKLEFGFNVRFFERLVFISDFGSMVLNPLKAYDNAVFYTVEGTYGRIGLDYYVTYNPKNFYFFGLRYGISNFMDEGAFLIESDYWEDYQEGFGSENITASWMEIVLGTETYLSFGKNSKENPKSRLLLGWNGSLRILADFTNREDIPIYSIPGYGRSFNKITPALNFYLKYRLGR